MKFIFSIILFGLLSATTAFGQESAKSPFSVDAVTPPNQQAGNTNYTLSLSDEDFKNQKYVFYTDSNATVAYIRINRSIIRLTGGPNPENILAYATKGYTVTLNFNKNELNTIVNNTDTHVSIKRDATLVIYNNTGQVLSKNVTGAQINAVGK